MYILMWWSKLMTDRTLDASASKYGSADIKITNRGLTTTITIEAIQKYAGKQVDHLGPILIHQEMNREGVNNWYGKGDKTIEKPRFRRNPTQFFFAYSGTPLLEEAPSGKVTCSPAIHRYVSYELSTPSSHINEGSYHLSAASSIPWVIDMGSCKVKT